MTAAVVAANSTEAGAAAGETVVVSGPGIIDVHHHVVPPIFLASQPSFPPWVHHWRVEHSIEAMDRTGIATAITSLAAPGLDTADPAEGRRLARGCNEYAAGLRRDHPDALGTQDVQGIGMMTSYRKSYLASQKFAPLFEELNRRRAAVFVHPTLPAISDDFDPPLSNVPLEMPFDTARTLYGMILAGTFRRYPDIRFIFNHGGGALPGLHQRLDLGFAANAQTRERFAGGVLNELRNVYFDTINVINPANFAMLRQLTALDRLLFGTDFPGHPAEANVEPLLALPVTADERRAIARDNALRLFPSLDARTAQAS